MSEKERDRYQILKRVLDGILTERDAGQLLGLTDRQIRNLIKAIREEGPQGLVSRKRGRSNHQKFLVFKKKVLSKISNSYPGFGPTFVQEKLEARDNLKVSVETLRLWMIDHLLWMPRKKERNIIHFEIAELVLGNLFKLMDLIIDGLVKIIL